MEHAERPLRHGAAGHDRRSASTCWALDSSSSLAKHFCLSKKLTVPTRNFPGLLETKLVEKELVVVTRDQLSLTRLPARWYRFRSRQNPHPVTLDGRFLWPRW